MGERETANSKIHWLTPFLKMKTNNNGLAGWVFDLEEVSAGVYHASATDGMGRKVELTGIDPDKLRDECRRAAEEIEKSISPKNNDFG